jgi:hypothetical protein
VHATWDGDDACWVDDGGGKKGRGVHMSYRADYPSFAGPEGHGWLKYRGLPGAIAAITILRALSDQGVCRTVPL